MRTSKRIAYPVLDWYDVLYIGEETDDSIGLGRRRRVLDSYEFRFSI
jgi:hypothetical protein